MVANTPAGDAGCRLSGDARLRARGSSGRALVQIRWGMLEPPPSFRPIVVNGVRPLTFGEMTKHLSAALGRTITFVDVPPEAMRGALAGLGFPAWQADGLLEEFAMYRRGEAAGVESGMLEALGKNPRSFGEFARDYAPLFG